MSIYRFIWREIHHAGPPVVPVFLPFAGCRTRCVYCAQPEQTGRGPLAGEDPAPALARGEAMLRERKTRGLPPAEAAFYGGTFTAQHPPFLETCLDAASAWLHEGLITRWRCSTRPDALDPALLSRMRALGCATVEIGVQSFDEAVLRASHRAYDGETAAGAMRLVRARGMDAGAQLLPGLPGSTPAIFLEDVRRALALGCALLRFYPCLVLRGTGLASLYGRGLYRPWELPATIDALGQGWRMAMDAGVPVIRMGVASEPSLLESLIAGPWDPALGTRVRSRALARALRDCLPAGERAVSAIIPRAAQGYLWGQGRETAPRLAELGVTPATVTWGEGPEVVITTAG